ncbi:putative Kunitz-type serine protease inhibitor [Varanus komodoensis]|nr:putative Kunitz-type serine protease inhibitor [Varanus komodoensis]
MAERADGRPQWGRVLPCSVPCRFCPQHPATFCPPAESCAAPPAVGSCRASFPRWYFDTETQTCRKFIYGGCGGNKNNYLFQEQCLRQCSGAGETSHGQEEPHTHPHSFAGPLVHPVRVAVVAVLLAVMVTVLLGTVVLFVAKIWKSRQLSLGPVWSTLDDKERLMSNAYTL